MLLRARRSGGAVVRSDDRCPKRRGSGLRHSHRIRAATDSKYWSMDLTDMDLGVVAGALSNAIVVALVAEHRSVRAALNRLQTLANPDGVNNPIFQWH